MKRPKPLPKPSVDRDKLRVALRKMRKQAHVALLGRAIDLLPPAKLARWISGYLRLDDLRQESDDPVELLKTVKRFHGQSLQGEYFESFDVNWKNSTDVSQGTAFWIAECVRLLGLGVQASKGDQHDQAADSFRLIFDLLERIDDGHEIIFFADEAGSWQVGVDWREVIPAYARCLSGTTTATDFAAAIRRFIDQYAQHDRDRLLRAVRRGATREERLALGAGA